MSGITTHILDLASGLPASDVEIEVFFFQAVSAKWELINKAYTNTDGRLDSPFIQGDALQTGSYELLFHIGEYYKSKGSIMPEPPFLDLIPVRFGIADSNAHYHVPLLVSPWGYQIYRGS